MQRAVTKMIIKKIAEAALEKEEDEIEHEEEVERHGSTLKRKRTRAEERLIKMLDNELLKMKGFDKTIPIYEHSLAVFMPGEKINFIERWCSVTRFCFQYHTRQKKR